MRRTNWILPALAALTLVTPLAASARPRAPISGTLPNLMIDRTRTASQTMVNIRNNGSAASTTCHVRIVLETGGVFHFGIWGLQPGEACSMLLPSLQKGKPYAFTITVDCDQEVAESNENDNVESMRFIP